MLAFTRRQECEAHACGLLLLFNSAGCCEADPLVLFENGVM
jgi:hypothetical protein